MYGTVPRTCLPKKFNNYVTILREKKINALAQFINALWINIQTHAKHIHCTVNVKYAIMTTTATLSSALDTAVMLVDIFQQFVKPVHTDDAGNIALEFVDGGWLELVEEIDGRQEVLWKVAGQQVALQTDEEVDEALR